MRWTDFLFLREGICLSCREEEIHDDPFCPDCMAQFEKEMGAFYYDDEHICHIAYFYNRFLQELMRVFKFKEQAELAKPMGELFVRMICEKNIQVDGIIAVPMTKEAVRKRGYNQSVLLAEEIAEKMHLPLLTPIEKRKKTKEQNKLSRSERQHNLKGAFHLTKPSDVRGKRILLVDDFVTTGSTMIAVTQELLKGEPQEVIGAAFAAPRLYSHDTLQSHVKIW